jgi:hypothetical protein
MYTLILHIQNEEPVVGEVEQLPDVTDVFITLTNPRRIDGKDLHYLSENAIQVSWPIVRLTFFEILATRDEDEIIGFVRE